MSIVTLPKPARRSRKARKPIARRRTLGAKRREAKAAGEFDQFKWEAIIRFYNGLCAYCEEDFWSEQDHRVPLSRGGRHCAENCLPACIRCNRFKGTQTWWPKRRHPWMEAK